LYRLSKNKFVEYNGNNESEEEVKEEEEVKVTTRGRGI
jgi:hypothetical protein